MEIAEPTILHSIRFEVFWSFLSFFFFFNNFIFLYIIKDKLYHKFTTIKTTKLLTQSSKLHLVNTNHLNLLFKDQRKIYFNIEKIQKIIIKYHKFSHHWISLILLSIKDLSSIKKKKDEIDNWAMEGQLKKGSSLSTIFLKKII